MNHPMNRRAFLRASAASTFALAALAQTGRADTQPAKPNLLFLWTDEQRADTMAAYGNTKIQAPNLNRFAAESVVFERAYVTQAICTPSRSSVMTGLWPHTNGCTNNNIPLRTDTPCLPELLADPDYRTAYMGKWHLGDEIFRQHGFGEWISIEDVYARYYTKGRDRSQRSDYHAFLLEKGYKTNGVFSRDFAAGLPIEHCKPKFLELKACDFLRRHRDRPFMLYVNFLEPHMPFTGPLNHVHDPKDVDLPANFADPLEDNEPLRYRHLRKKLYQPEKQARRTIANYWGLVTQVDRSVGAILQTLEDLGLADNTIVVFTSDHGDMMGSHGLFQKCVMYEEAVRVPWLMRIPSLGRTRRRIGQPVSHIDLVPTLLDLLRGRGDARLPGRSLVPLIKGGKAEEDHVFIEWNPAKERETPAAKHAKALKVDEEKIRHVFGESTRTVIAPDGWKLCLSDRDKCQLFHLKNDPGETTNLYDSGKHADVIERLTHKIRQWQERTDDTLKL